MTCFMCYGYIVAAAAVGLYFLRMYVQGGQFTKDVRLDGKVVIITGSNTGIGKETALEIAKRGARVYMACRSFSKCEEARKEIIKLSDNQNVFNMTVDLSSMESVRNFVKEFLQKEKTLNILINNAGCMGLSRTLTTDGYETVFASNHLGHFLLTNLLTDTLKNSTPSRVVNVSSSLHTIGKIIREDLHGEKSYSYWNVYGNSKLANVLFTREFAKRMKGAGVTSYALHPGAVHTDITRNFPIIQAIMPLLSGIVSSFFLKTAKSGAQTTLACALDPDLENISGRYFVDCKIAKESKDAKNDDDAEWLWRTSEKLAGKFIQNDQFTKDVRIDEKVVIVTGTNTGIGKATALDLARRGARVYMACRSFSKCEDARKEIIELSGNQNVFNMTLDLSSMESVRKFVKEFLKKEKTLHILVNNAGCIGLPRTITKDGYETVFAANYLGHFLLTNLLMDTLKDSAPTRVVNVSSAFHKIGRIVRDDLHGERTYSFWKAYGNSKLAIVLFSREFAKRMKGRGVTSYSLHPGGVRTDICRNIPILQALMSAMISSFTLNSPMSGAQTTLACALDPDLKDISGRYFVNCKIATESKGAQNDDDAEWLWRTSEKLTGLVN